MTAAIPAPDYFERELLALIELYQSRGDAEMVGALLVDLQTYRDEYPRVGWVQ